MNLGKIKDLLKDLKSKNKMFAAGIVADRKILLQILKSNEIQFALDMQDEIDKNNISLFGLEEKKKELSGSPTRE